MHFQIENLGRNTVIVIICVFILSPNDQKNVTTVIVFRALFYDFELAITSDILLPILLHFHEQDVLLQTLVMVMLMKFRIHWRMKVLHAQQQLIKRTGSQMRHILIPLK